MKLKLTILLSACILTTSGFAFERQTLMPQQVHFYNFTYSGDISEPVWGQITRNMIKDAEYEYFYKVAMERSDDFQYAMEINGLITMVR